MGGKNPSTGGGGLNPVIVPGAKGLQGVLDKSGTYTGTGAGPEILLTVTPGASRSTPALQVHGAGSNWSSGTLVQLKNTNADGGLDLLELLAHNKTSVGWGSSDGTRRWSLSHANNDWSLKQEQDISAGDGVTFTAATGAELTDTDAAQCWLCLKPNINQSGSASYTGLLLDVTETAAVGTSDKLMDLQVGSATKFNVDSSGRAIIRALATATTSSLMHNGSVTFYLNEATDKVIIAAKYSGGTTVLTSELALT